MAPAPRIAWATRSNRGEPTGTYCDRTFTHPQASEGRGKEKQLISLE